MEGPETSAMLENILGKWGGLWLPAKERTLTAVNQEKSYYFYVLTCSVDSVGFFKFVFVLFFSPFVVVVNFIGIMKSN